MRYTLNVRGGTERARYFVSGAFYQENGIFKDFGNDYDNNIGLKRYNLRSNIDFNATKTLSLIHILILTKSTTCAALMNLNTFFHYGYPLQGLL